MSSPLKTYRVVCYDAARHEVSSDIVEAASDEEVIANAYASGFGTRCEIWEGNRLGAQLEGERRQA